MSNNNTQVLELCQQLLSAAQNENESDSALDRESLVHQLATYGQVCPECGDTDSLQDAADDWTFDFVWDIAHNKDLLRLFIYCAYQHLSKRDVESAVRQAGKNFCLDADEGQMHFHLTGEHLADCCCPKCEGLTDSKEYGAIMTAVGEGECCCCEECEEEVAA